MLNFSFISICSIRHGSLWKLKLRNRIFYIKSVSQKLSQSLLFIFSQVKPLYVLTSKLLMGEGDPNKQWNGFF